MVLQREKLPMIQWYYKREACKSDDRTPRTANELNGDSLVWIFDPWRFLYPYSFLICDVITEWGPSLGSTSCSFAGKSNLFSFMYHWAAVIGINGAPSLTQYPSVIIHSCNGVTKRFYTTFFTYATSAPQKNSKHPLMWEIGGFALNTLRDEAREGFSLCGCAIPCSVPRLVFTTHLQPAHLRPNWVATCVVWGSFIKYEFCENGFRRGKKHAGARRVGSKRGNNKNKRNTPTSEENTVWRQPND